MAHSAKLFETVHIVTKTNQNNWKYLILMIGSFATLTLTTFTVKTIGIESLNPLDIF